LEGRRAHPFEIEILGCKLTEFTRLDPLQRKVVLLRNQWAVGGVRHRTDGLLRGNKVWMCLNGLATGGMRVDWTGWMFIFYVVRSGCKLKSSIG